MFQNLEIFQTASAMARHAGAKQAVIAQNIANADTPGFRAREIAPFKEALKSGSEQLQFATRPGHIINQYQLRPDVSSRFTQTEPSPNGNSVSIEEEMLKAVSVSQDHTRALAIYRHGMTVLRTVLGR